MKKGFMRAALHDVGVSVLVGLGAAAGSSVLLFLIGLLFNRFDPRGALVLVRGGLLVIGAMELFVSAGLLLFNKDGGKLQDSSHWKQLFHVFGLFPVLLVSAAAILTAASFVDYYLYF